MAKRTPRQLRLRRHNRVRRRVSGTASRPRLNVFRSSANIYAQVIDDVDGRTLAAASSIDKQAGDEMQGKTKTEQAKVVGRLIAERARAAGVEQVIFDRGGFKYHGRVQALADSAREAGLIF